MYNNPILNININVTTLISVLKILQNKPINAEAPGPLITQEYITPNDLWFVRNHHPVPIIDPNTYRLVVKDINGNKLKSYSLQDLAKMPQSIITATIQCGGKLH
jgi:sulfite oxidase